MFTSFLNFEYTVYNGKNEWSRIRDSMNLRHPNSRTRDTQWRHKSKKFEKLGRYGRQNMLRPYLKIWDWDLILGRAVKAISSRGVRSPCLSSLTRGRALKILQQNASDLKFAKMVLYCFWPHCVCTAETLPETIVSGPLCITDLFQNKISL